MRIEITRHNGGNNVHVGFVTINGDDVTTDEIDVIANEDGLSDVAAMGESTISEGYEWTGDEVYEVVE